MSFKDNLKDNWNRGKEVLGAYLRQGMHELGSVFYGPGTAAQHPEYGMAWTKTPGEVADTFRSSPSAAPARDDPTPSVVDDHLRQAAERSSPGIDQSREARAIDRDPD